MKNPYQLFVLVLLIALVYGSWFIPGLITSGDFWYFYPSMYGLFDVAFSAWNWEKGNGLGLNSVLYQAVLFDFGLPITLLGGICNFSWQVIERFGFFYPFLIIGSVGSYVLHKNVFRDNVLWIVTAIVILFNTYILTLVGGGQILIGIAYAFSAIVLSAFIKNINDDKKYSFLIYVRNIIVLGVLFGIDVLLDLRIAYILAIAVTLYYLVYLILSISKNNISNMVRKLLFSVLLPILFAFVLNGFWSLSLVINRRNPLQALGSAYSDVASVKFFSFATLENSISLLHPNWPENLFGKVSFMRPEFILIPVIAFSGLLLLGRVKSTKLSRMIIFFAILGLVGAFLAKGANEPFGGVYLFLFEHIPGMVMFRDPTKFYMLVVLSFSILIPFTLYQIVGIFKKVKYLSIIFIFIFIIFWLTSISNAIFHQLGGTFKHTTIPNEYLQLETFLRNDHEFSRTFWIPQVQRFGYYSPTHPPMVAEDFLQIYSYDKLAKKIVDLRTQRVLENMSVKYIIIPYDSEGEIFLDDRKYNPKLQQILTNKVSADSGLKKIKQFSQIGVYELSNPKPHFWSERGIIKNYSRVSAVKYRVNLVNAKKGDRIVFSEGYDSGWKGKIIGEKSNPVLISFPYEKHINSFTINRSGSYILEVYYENQIWVNIGIVVSIVVIIISIVFITITYKK